MDHIWLLLCGALVMFMQVGFAALETGAVRAEERTACADEEPHGRMHRHHVLVVRWMDDGLWC